MRFVELLCEGTSDVPAATEALVRGLGLKRDVHFRVHPHQGKGKLPANPLAKPAPGQRGLLDQLPAKLRGYGQAETPEYDFVVVVLVDADNDNCVELKSRIVALYNQLPSKPTRFLVRIAVEETESWFIADHAAVRKAYPHAKLSLLQKIHPDQVCGAWERLAEALGENATDGGDKLGWATAISPHLNLSNPPSPSLRCFLNGVKRVIGGP